MRAPSHVRRRLLGALACALVASVVLRADRVVE
jgi:hypothetical protein